MVKMGEKDEKLRFEDNEDFSMCIRCNRLRYVFRDRKNWNTFAFNPLCFAIGFFSHILIVFHCIFGSQYLCYHDSCNWLQ